MKPKAARDLALWRFNPDGRPDESFGQFGRSFVGGNITCSDIACSPDGRILAVGSRHSEGKLLLDSDVVSDDVHVQFVLLRMDSDGTLDNIFGEEGIAPITKKLRSWGSGTHALEVMSDNLGRILVAGNYNNLMTVWRFLPDGMTDTVFGNDTGRFRDSSGAGLGFRYGSALGLDNRNRIIVTGRKLTQNYVTNVDGGIRESVMALWGLSPDREIDTSFGNEGLFMHSGSAEK